MHSAAYAIVWCLSVCLSVCHFHVLCRKKQTYSQSCLHSGRTIILFRTKRYCNIPTRRGQMQVGMKKSLFWTNMSLYLGNGTIWSYSYNGILSCLVNKDVQ